MKEELITIETAKLAKKKGFDLKVKECFSLGLIPPDEGNLKSFTNIKPANFNKFNDVWSRPTHSLLQRWLREVHKLNVEVEFDYAYEIDEGKGNYSDAIFKVKIADISNPKKYNVIAPNWQRKDGNQFTYEGALEKGLIEALKLIKK